MPTLEEIRLPDPSRGEGSPVMDGDVPAENCPVVLVLERHPQIYVVTTRREYGGPVITELRIIAVPSPSQADLGINYAVVMRGLPLQTMGNWACSWLADQRGENKQPVRTFKDRYSSFQRPHRVDAAFLEEFASFIKGLPAPDQTVKAVARTLYKTEATITRWVDKAAGLGIEVGL